MTLVNLCSGLISSQILHEQAALAVVEDHARYEIVEVGFQFFHLQEKFFI